ncbi:snake venom serine protease-like isoform X1 [Crotalus tigris]|uniref:snake venom serine protease-like isoform X1 n=1 Tax=Crotalus tigris TaxID=88082 RepID=UPI00192F48C8|nr:snake venom serine protease-like isoform X1 [Crotalus tigris]
MLIFLGMHSLEVPNKDVQKRVAKEKFICPNRKKDDKKDKDIMLIRLDRPVSNSEHIVPLSLPSNPPSVGSVCRIMGWGAITSPNVTLPAFPHCANINIVRNALCRKAYAGLPATSRTLCAGILQGGKDACVKLIPMSLVVLTLTYLIMQCVKQLTHGGQRQPEHCVQVFWKEAKMHVWVTLGDPSSVMEKSRALYLGGRILVADVVSLASTPRSSIILTGSRALLQEIQMQLAPL